MTKFAYVDEYKMFERAEVRVAEELLAEYQDFFVYNQSQYRDIFRKFDVDDDGDDDEKTIEAKRLRAEMNSKAASDHFGLLFGSKDFAHSALLGLRINWDNLQQILLEEFRCKTLATMSAMNHIAPTLRKLASILLFAEYFYDKLNRMYKTKENPKNDEHNEKIDKTVAGVKIYFENLVEGLAKNSGAEIPEFTKTKNQLAKLRNVEVIIEFVDKNLGC